MVGSETISRGRKIGLKPSAGSSRPHNRCSIFWWGEAFSLRRALARLPVIMANVITERFNKSDIERLLLEPSAADIASASKLEGDLLMLGAGGKMGPSLA